MTANEIVPNVTLDNRQEVRNTVTHNPNPLITSFLDEWDPLRHRDDSRPAHTGQSYPFNPESQRVRRRRIKSGLPTEGQGLRA